MANQKIAGICGLLFVGLSLVIMVTIPPFPTFATSAAEALKYYTQFKAPFLFGNALGIIAVLPSIFFATYFAEVLRRRGHEYRRTVFVISAAVIHAFAFTSLVAFQATGLSSVLGNEAITKFASDASNITLCYYLLLQGFYLALFASMSFAGGLLPKWSGFLAALVAVVSVVTSFGGIWPDGFLLPGGMLTNISFLGFALWIASTSVYLLAARTT